MGEEEGGFVLVEFGGEGGGEVEGFLFAVEAAGLGAVAGVQADELVAFDFKEVLNLSPKTETKAERSVWVW